MPTAETTDRAAFAEWVREQVEAYDRQGTAEARWLAAKVNDLWLEVLHLAAAGPDEFEARSEVLLADLA